MEAANLSKTNFTRACMSNVNLKDANMLEAIVDETEFNSSVLADAIKQCLSSIQKQAADYTASVTG